MGNVFVVATYYRGRETAMPKKKKNYEQGTDATGKTESGWKRFWNHQWVVSITCSVIAGLFVYFAIQLPMEDNLGNAINNYFEKNNLTVVSQADTVEANPEMTNINSSGNTQTNANASNGGTSIGEAGTTTVNNYNYYYNYSKDDSVKKMARPFLLSVGESGEALEVSSDMVSSETDSAMEELRNQRVLMVYEWAGAEYYFLGQFDSSGRWDGDCTLNVYMNGILRVITEGRFEGGTMVSRLQAYNQNSGSWLLSDRRVAEDGHLSGESWTYPYHSYSQGFASETVTEQDIKTYANFKQWLEEEQGLVYYKYYSGNISYSDSVSGTTYNDDTGKAYYAIYFENGNIETLYVGRFRDGKFDDGTGEAFWISKKTMTQSVYVYFKGRFEAGSPLAEDVDVNSGRTIWAMSQTQIDAKLAEAETVVGEPLRCRLDGLLADT